MKSNETKFCISKINLEIVKDDFPSLPDQLSAKETVDALINSIKKIVSEVKEHQGYYDIAKDGFQGVVFKTVHFPEWHQIISQMVPDLSEVTESGQNKFFSNSNISYVLFRVINKNSLYVMTGGYGNFYVQKYTEKNYGLYLLPKFLNSNYPGVKNIIENNLTGNRASTHRTNRNSTSFISEQDLSSIYKQLNVEIDRDVALKLGIVYADDESQYKKLNLINKDSIVIRRSISLGDLKKILINLNKLEKKPDNFALNYLVPAKKYRYKNSELVESLVENLLVKNFSNFLLVGDEYEKYVVNSDIYRILSADEKVFLKQETPITISDIFEELEKRNSRISKSLIYEILKKWKVETLDHLGNYLLQPTKLIDTLQGFIEFGYTNELIYLINGEWYMFDKNYSKLLNQEYEELFNHKKQIELQLLSSFLLKVKANDEESYNKSLKMNKKIIFADRNLIEYIEIADAIYWDDGNLFLMHNKMSFNGSGARDLANQILSAAELLKSNNNRYNRTFLEQYYLKLCKEYNTTELIQISKSGFIDMFASKKIWYVAGFVKDFKKKSKSNYAKYLMIELNKKLKEKDFDFIPFGIS